MAEPVVLLSWFIAFLVMLVAIIWLYVNIYPLFNKSGRVLIPANKQCVVLRNPEFVSAKVIGYKVISEHGDFDVLLKNQNRGVFNTNYNRRDYEELTDPIVPDRILVFNPDKVKRDVEEVVKLQLNAWKNMATGQNKDISNAVDKVLEHMKKLNKTTQKETEKKEDK